MGVSAMNISCASFLVQQDPAGKFSRESRDLEICLAYKTIEDERKKKEWISSITMVYWPFFILPLDQTRGVVLDGMGLTSSRLTIYPMRSIRTEDIQSVSDTSSFVRVAEQLVNQVLANYKVAAAKQSIEFLPDLSFLEESRPFFAYAEEIEADDEFVIKPTKRIDLGFLNRSPLQYLPSDAVIEREKTHFQEVTDEINQRIKQIKEELKQVRERHKTEKERLRKEKEGEIKERARVRDDELKLLEEKLAKGYPGAFPDSPDFKDHLSRLSSSFDQIKQISARKLVGEAIIAINGAKNASQVLTDDLESFRKRIEIFEAEVHEFEREMQRDKEAAHREHERDIKKIEANFAEALDDLEREVDAYLSDEQTLAELKVKLRSGYDKWFNSQASAREKLDRRTVRLESSQRSNQEVKLVYLPMYLIDYSSTKKERFAIISPHLIEAGKKMKVQSPPSLANFSLLAANHLEKKMESWRSLETLKGHNQLRSAAIQEIFERGIRAAERRSILSSKESRILGEKYYRNFVPE
ncbi:MAG: hypothetical protein ACXACI_04805 [Candidatus Hodarchaeales archaeon]|jgi:hypothetical protein